MTAAPAIKLSGMNIVDKTIDEAIIAEPPAKPTSNTRTIEEISAELNAEWISDIIAHMAESARRNPDARSQLPRPGSLMGMFFSITASIGIAIYPAGGETADILFKNADTAMYQAKGTERRIVLFCDLR